MSSALLEQRWASGEHVGEAKPTNTVLIRLGHFSRGYPTWEGPEVDARIWGETARQPWQATWVPFTDWFELPNATDIEITQDYDANGLLVATIILTNVGFIERPAAGDDIYHLIERGYLSPWRGAGLQSPPPPEEPNEWAGMLDRKAQVKVLEGYGDEQDEAWTGLIDDCDLTAAPDRVTIVGRDFGQVLTDEAVFGWVVSQQLDEPLIFESSGAKKRVGVGTDPAAKSTRPGHPARFVADKNAQSRWISADHVSPDDLEWVQVRLPKGRYESFSLHPGYAGMEVFAGIFARSDGLGGPCTVNGREIADGWIFSGELDDPARGGMTGDDDDWPYVKRWKSMGGKPGARKLGAMFELGNDSVLRIGFRKLHRITPGIHRAAVARLQALRIKPTPPRMKHVGDDPDSSSQQPDHPAAHVLDTRRDTRWESAGHATDANTEWVEIHVPSGTYESISVELAEPGMTMYVGVFARDRYADKKARVDGVEVDEGFVDVGNGDVPGAEGGWPWVAMFEDVAAGDSAETFDLGHVLELGENSVIRLGFRVLADVGVDDPSFRAGVVRFKARTRRAETAEEKANKKVIRVGDVSEIVKVVLRWAGFKEWRVESTGTGMKGRLSFNRSHKLIDVIKAVQEATGYVFYMLEGTGDDLSIGVPVFEANLAIANLQNLEVLADDELLTGVQSKSTDEPLATDIRVMGKLDRKRGVPLGNPAADRRIMAHYKTPWGIRTQRMAGLIRHVMEYYPAIKRQEDCEILARLIGLAEALAATAAQVEIPGTTHLKLNRQVIVSDTGTGIHSRMHVVRRSSTFRGTSGSGAVYTTALGGALLDTPDVQAVLDDLRASLSAAGLDPEKISLGDTFFEDAE